MLHFLGFLFILIIAILIIGVSIIFSIARGLFGIGRKKTSSRNFQGGYTFYGDNRQSSRTSTTDTNDGIRPEEGEIRIRHKERIFSKDDGEYVDYEEIKE
ncbi:DUF4834 family protein [uncultured Mediterranea sp.]|uniref:DUF4834 family protein n=1 Tax=uncultured Mediterranea sp. TaxID=1926662 RepID=UPI0027D9384B|nr:DUF4834 family protein [uncultured Mediterranea sp.]